MHTLSRRPWAMTAYSLLVACLLFVMSPSAETTDKNESCARALEWASSYVATHTTPTLDAIAQLTRAQRVGVFNAVTPEVRADLWREQLRRFAARPELNEAQRASILAARNKINAATYTLDNRPAKLQAARARWAANAPLFPSAEHRRLWFDLGSAANASRLAGSQAVTLLTRISTTSAQPPPFCECSGEWGWVECWPGTCEPEFCRSHWNCGPGGEFECVGMCLS